VTLQEFAALTASPETWEILLLLLVVFALRALADW